jgi:hypothetical protein
VPRAAGKLGGVGGRCKAALLPFTYEKFVDFYASFGIAVRTLIVAPDGFRLFVVLCGFSDSALDC